MSSPVSSVQHAPPAPAAAPKAPPAPPKAPPAPPPQDTVQLSSKATGGDVDHDGDSH